MAMVLALLLPFGLVDVPPVLDYPNHLARIFVLAHPGDAILSQFYAPHWGILPNLGLDAIGVLLLKILPVHVGGRILLASSLLAPVLGVLAYSRAAFGRLSWWALACGLTAYNGAFFLGFMNFLLALGLGFAAAALWLTLRRRGWSQAVIAGALASALLFFCHIFGVLLFALLIGSAEAERLWNCRKNLAGRDVLRTAFLLTLTLMPALILFGFSSLSNGGVAAGSWLGFHKVWDAFTPFMSPSKNVTLLTGLCVFGFLILNLRHARFAPGARLALITLALLFVLAPDTIKGGTFMDTRLALMFGLLLFAGIRPAASQARAWPALFAALVVLHVCVVALNWGAHRADVEDLRAAMAPVPAGATVLVAQGPAPDRLMMPGLYRLDSHAAGLLVIERRAFWPQLFADPGQQPLTVRPPFDRIAQSSGEPLDWALLQQPVTARTAAALPYLRDWRRDFDFVLLLEPPKGGPPAGLAPLHQGAFAALYRIARQAPIVQRNSRQP